MPCDVNFIAVLITITEGNQALRSTPLQGLGMSKPEVSPFLELGLLQRVYFLEAVKILLLGKVIAITSPQIGALEQCPNFPSSSFHYFCGCPFVNSFNKLLDARYNPAADMLMKYSPCCQMAYYSVGETKYLYKPSK